MKKVVIALAIIVALAVCLCACNLTLNNSELNKLNEMIAIDRNNVDIEVKATANGETLTNTFSVKTQDGKSVIDYRIESLNSLSINGNNEDSYKKVTEGTVEVENKQITQLNGEPVDIAFEEIKNPTFTFKSSYFNYVLITETNIELEVKNPSAFMGINNFDGKNMIFVATYEEDLFKSIKLTYTMSNGSMIEIQYTYPAEKFE